MHVTFTGLHFEKMEILIFKNIITFRIRLKISLQLITVGSLSSDLNNFVPLNDHYHIICDVATVESI